MLEIILSLIFTFALAQSNIQTANEIRESKNTMPIEKKVVQTVKVEKEKEAVKVKPKAVAVETKKEEEWMLFEVSAYTNGKESTNKVKGDKDYAKTASGKMTKEGRTVSADEMFPFGTILYIDGVGERVVEDRGGAIKGHKLDLFIEDLQEARNFGRKYNVKVKVIKMGEKKD